VKTHERLLPYFQKSSERTVKHFFQDEKKKVLCCNKENYPVTVVESEREREREKEKQRKHLSPTNPNVSWEGAPASS